MSRGFSNICAAITFACVCVSMCESARCAHTSVYICIHICTLQSSMLFPSSPLSSLPPSLTYRSKANLPRQRSKDGLVLGPRDLIRTVRAAQLLDESRRVKRDLRGREGANNVCMRKKGSTAEENIAKRLQYQSVLSTSFLTSIVICTRRRWFLARRSAWRLIPVLPASEMIATNFSPA